MKQIIIRFKSMKSSGMMILERMSNIHPVMTFIMLTLMLPMFLLAAVAGGAVVIALPFCMI